MKVVVTGSSGHLGEALVRTLRDQGAAVVGVDIKESEFTDIVASITDRAAVADALDGADSVIHTAALHKPHIVTHAKEDFIDTNITGTLVLLEQAVEARIRSFVFTSSTSVFGHALRPTASGAAVWVTEAINAIPKNIYGITKAAAESLCELFYGKHGLKCIVLRTSRFFPDEDDSVEMRVQYADANLKANEFLFRRADLHDVVCAHVLAMERAESVGLARLVISATTPFRRQDVTDLKTDARSVVRKYFPRQPAIYEKLGWTMFPSIDRVYDNSSARQVLGWHPRYDYLHILASAEQGTDPRSEVARAIGTKYYHAEVFEEGPYPVE